MYETYIYIILYKALQIIGLKYQPQLASKFSDPSTVWSLKNKTISSPWRNISAWFFRFLNGFFKRPFGSFMIFCDFKWGRSEPLETLSHGVPCSPPPKRFEDWESRSHRSHLKLWKLDQVKLWTPPLFYSIDCLVWCEQPSSCCDPLLGPCRSI